jgi:hypothetical protein
MNPAANHCPLPKSAVWRFLSLYFHRKTALPKHRNTSSNPLFPRNPHFPAYRSGHRLLQRPSPRKQFPSIGMDDYLSKPIKRNNLTQCLDHWVK